MSEAAKALAWLAKNPQCELSFAAWEEEPKWQVHSVTGPRSDREWRLVAEGETPLHALTAAMLARRGAPP